MAIDKNVLRDKFMRVTGCSEAKAERYVSRYISACAAAMLSDQYSCDSQSLYYINATQIDAKLSSIMINGVRYYVWTTFQSFKERIFDIVTPGDNIRKKLTMAQSQYSLEHIIMAAGTPKELWDEIYAPFMDMPYDLVPIDLTSLGNYIAYQLDELDSGAHSPSVQEMIKRNIKHAQKIVMIAGADDGNMRHVIKESAFGRKYYIGPNLQTAPKAVRHAALGDCWESDLQCNVFAWKLDLVKKIFAMENETCPLPATIEYVTQKDATRKGLARRVFGTDNSWAVNIIKQFITAIGFGAKARTGYYPTADGGFEINALPSIITSKEKLEIALNDSWVKEFMDEQVMMNKCIIGYYTICHPSHFMFSESALRDKKGGIKINAAIAYLYQHTERGLLNDLVAECQKTNREVLLTVHDCLYTRREPKMEDLMGICKLHGDEYSIKPEQHRAWKKKQIENTVDKNSPFYDPRESVNWNKKFRRSSGEGFYQPSDEEQEQINMEMAAMIRTEMIDDITGRMYAN